MTSINDILDDMEDAIKVIDGTGNYTYNLGKNIQFEMDTPDIEIQEKSLVNPKVIIVYNNIEIEDWSTTDFESIAEITIVGYLKQDQAWTGSKVERKKLLTLQRDMFSAVYQMFKRQSTVVGTEQFSLEGTIRSRLGKAGTIAHVNLEFNIRFEETAQ